MNDIKRITFRVDYYCSPAVFNKIIDKITDVFDYELMYRRLTELDLQYCEINSVADNLGIDKYNLTSINKEESYVLYYKTETYYLIVFVNRYFTACMFDNVIYNDSVVKEIMDIASTIENVIHEAKGQKFLDKTCWLLKFHKYSPLEICNLDFKIQDIDNFDKSEYSEIKYIDDIKLEKKKILMKFRDNETHKVESFSYIIKSYASSDDQENDWKLLFEKAEKEI